MELNAEIIIALFTMLLAMLAICTTLIHSVRTSYA